MKVAWKRTNKSYDKYIKRRKRTKLTDYDNALIHQISSKVAKGNVDNISRTKYYDHFFLRHSEIKWAFLASMVSRNAGWNMTDLEGKWLPHCIKKDLRWDIFLTYERANWLIFADAYPQLLIYEASKNEKRSLFYLLKEFSVSPFMEMEWERFWISNNKERLMIAQIINEQSVIQKPVIDYQFTKHDVFHSLPFLLQDWFHFSTVIFPTLEGKLFGYSVHQFTKLHERIQLGKQLAWLLFHPHFHHQFRQFSELTEHTGSRYDYERYMDKRYRCSPFLRTIYPVIEHHRHDIDEWYTGQREIKKWFKAPKLSRKYDITKWYMKKQKQLHSAIIAENLLFK